MARKCQLCDGAIVNGRCKLCGMPYRKDEELYHLNEDRKTYYQHASNSARRKMREQGLSAADVRRKQREEENPLAEQALGAVVKNKLKTTKSSVGQAYQTQKQRIQPQVSKIKKYSTSIGKIDSAAFEREKTGRGNRRTLGGKVIFLMLFLSIGAQVLSSCSDSLTERFGNNSYTGEDLDQEMEWSDETEYKTLEEALAGTEENEFMDSFYLLPEEAWETIENTSPIATLMNDSSEYILYPGYYLAYAQYGGGTIRIEGQYGTVTMSVSQNENYVAFEMADGETLSMPEEEMEDSVVEIYLLQTLS